MRRAGRWALARLREPSTWAGIGVAVTAGAQAWQTADPQAIGAAVAAVLAVLMRERST